MGDLDTELNSILCVLDTRTSAVFKGRLSVLTPTCIRKMMSIFTIATTVTLTRTSFPGGAVKFRASPLRTALPKPNAAHERYISFRDTSPIRESGILTLFIGDEVHDDINAERARGSLTRDLRQRECAVRPELEREIARLLLIVHRENSCPVRLRDL